LHILLVDDEADSRELLSLVLSSCHADVTTASSAAEAFDADATETVRYSHQRYWDAWRRWLLLYQKNKGIIG
jgi:CheY-like chemotaxis protein